MPPALYKHSGFAEMSRSFCYTFGMEDETNNPIESPTPEPTETSVSEPSVPAPEVTESTAVSEPETLTTSREEACEDHGASCYTNSRD